MDARGKSSAELVIEHQYKQNITFQVQKKYWVRNLNGIEKRSHQKVFMLYVYCDDYDDDDNNSKKIYEEKTEIIEID